MNQSDKVFASALYAAEERRTFTAGDVLDAAGAIQRIDTPPARRTVIEHCNNLAKIGVIEKVDSGRWTFVGAYDPSR